MDGTINIEWRGLPGNIYFVSLVETNGAVFITDFTFYYGPLWQLVWLGH